MEIVSQPFSLLLSLGVTVCRFPLPQFSSISGEPFHCGSQIFFSGLFFRDCLVLCVCVSFHVYVRSNALSFTFSVFWWWGYFVSRYLISTYAAFFFCSLFERMNFMQYAHYNLSYLITRIKTQKKQQITYVRIWCCYVLFFISLLMLIKHGIMPNTHTHTCSIV